MHARSEMEEGVPIAEGLNLYSGFVKTFVIGGKRCVPVAKDFPKEVADFAKCVPAVNSALQVLVMCASKAETGNLVKRVKVEWPPIYSRLLDLPVAIVKIMIPVLHLNR